MVIGPRRKAYSQSGCTRAPSGVNIGGPSDGSASSFAKSPPSPSMTWQPTQLRRCTSVRPAPDEVVFRGSRRHRRRRLNLALEAHDRDQQTIDFLVVEVEIRHAQLLFGLQHASAVENPRIVELGPEPRRLRGVRDVGDEREIEPRHQLAALFRQVRADRLGLLEALDIVAAEATVAADHALPELDRLLFWH